MRAELEAKLEPELGELKSLGIEELERRAEVAHIHIKALDFDTSEEGIQAREELIRVQNLLVEARAELLEDEDLPPPVVVGMKSAYMKPKLVLENKGYLRLTL